MAADGASLNCSFAKLVLCSFWLTVSTWGEMRERVTKCKVASDHVSYPIIVIPL